MRSIADNYDGFRTGDPGGTAIAEIIHEIDLHDDIDNEMLDAPYQNKRTSGESRS